MAGLVLSESKAVDRGGEMEEDEVDNDDDADDDPDDDDGGVGEGLRSPGGRAWGTSCPASFA